MDPNIVGYREADCGRGASCEGERKEASGCNHIMASEDAARDGMVVNDG